MMQSTQGRDETRKGFKMRRDRELFNLERRYVGKRVKYYQADLPTRSRNELPKYGPYYGTVLMLTNDEAYAERRGEKSYSFTGEMLIYPDDESPEVFISIDDIYIVAERIQNEC
jgi:hypothetical protein